MGDSDIFIGNSQLKKGQSQVTGEYTTIYGEEYYKISHYDQMRPFFMTIVSDSDHWLFISSNGSLSAGRNNADSALFPYYTDDKITDNSEFTGNKTILKVKKDNKTFLWEPFSERYFGVYSTTRDLYKNRVGNKILFEETNEDLELTFRYLWAFSEKYGFVKKSVLINNSADVVEIDILDGVQNILPYGVDSELQNRRSTLVDAYKKNELIPESGIGIYSLSAMIVDKAEPSEALLATAVWSIGIEVNKHLLSSNQLISYRKGHEIEDEADIRAERGAYFINCQKVVAAKGTVDWYIISDVNQSSANIDDIKGRLSDTKSLKKSLEADISHGTENLLKIVGMADGIQLSSNNLSTGRHFSNVLFNIMRGGIFEDQYIIYTGDFMAHLLVLNREIAEQYERLVEGISPSTSYQNLLEKAAESKNLDFERICYEYLPLSFSRRHGDPSRPWNSFSIESNDQFGRRIKNYEGNWRDIFQNWESLAISFPEYLEAIITKFVNASTIDGYNPYRITREGIDWEIVEPDDPWSFIGYWGDHQIIYLSKLLELSDSHHPGRLNELMAKSINVYANVPYRIKGYKDILKDPSDTIIFDQELANVIDERTKRIGSDGKLVWDTDDKVVRANLAEKILVVVLTKLYNFIPEAGIWLNTQRPEWNDANNALVGNGVSMVTLYYLTRFLKFGIKLFSRLESSSVVLNKPVANLLISLNEIFSDRQNHLLLPFTDDARKEIMDHLGRAGEEYRSAAYKGFTGESQLVDCTDIINMLEVSLLFLQHSIEHNKREDGLYHSYNLIETTSTKVEVSNMYEMLEGQVAVLSAKSLTAEESILVLDALKKSKMFRPDQYSYLLYPDRDLPLFMERNVVPVNFVNNSLLVKKLFENGDNSLIEKDKNGAFHFNGLFHNVNDLTSELDRLSKAGYADLIHQENDSFLEVFEQIFDHKSFTGRSGTFYGYEGLGSIYWHMVSKLLLATQENIYLGNSEQIETSTMGRLIDHYYEIRAGIGLNKAPDLYGAFPTDAYSHTPGNLGAQQPGMTGQVKEDIINRWAELGLVVKNGQLTFEPIFLRKEEYLVNEGTFEYYDLNSLKKSLTLSKGSLAFTYCQVPVIYLLAGSSKIEISMANEAPIEVIGNIIPASFSEKIFQRTGEIELIKYFHKLNN
jgi:hypothetical protein